MNERLKQLKVEIVLAQIALSKLQAEEQSILRLAESNIFETLEEADREMYCILQDRASEDCEGSYNCGDDEYTQEFMVGNIKYLATMKFEYSRHDKTYYYIDSSKYSSNEVNQNILE